MFFESSGMVTIPLLFNNSFKKIMDADPEADDFQNIIDMIDISKPNFDKKNLSSRLRSNYFRFRKTDGRHIGFLFPVSISSYA